MDEEVEKLLSTISWIIRKHKKGDSIEETVRLLLLQEDKILEIMKTHEI